MREFIHLVLQNCEIESLIELIDKINNCSNKSFVQSIELASSIAEPTDHFLEFGVSKGTTLRTIRENTTNPVIGFDSFNGIPEQWNGELVGRYAVDTLPLIADTELWIGLFEHTIPYYVITKPTIRFVHIDCDLYSSTKTVLNKIYPYFASEVIICFDELMNYGNDEWRNHEYKALVEFISNTSAKVTPLFRYGSHQCCLSIKPHILQQI